MYMDTYVRHEWLYQIVIKHTSLTVCLPIWVNSKRCFIRSRYVLIYIAHIATIFQISRIIIISRIKREVYNAILENQSIRYLKSEIHLYTEYIIVGSKTFDLVFTVSWTFTYRLYWLVNSKRIYSAKFLVWTKWSILKF